MPVIIDAKICDFQVIIFFYYWTRVSRAESKIWELACVLISRWPFGSHAVCFSYRHFSDIYGFSTHAFTLKYKIYIILYNVRFILKTMLYNILKVITIKYCIFWLFFYLCPNTFKIWWFYHFKVNGLFEIPRIALLRSQLNI